MCTVRDIEEAIREHCQSQHDMESTEIDRPPVPKPPYSWHSRNYRI